MADFKGELTLVCGVIAQNTLYMQQVYCLGQIDRHTKAIACANILQHRQSRSLSKLFWTPFCSLALSLCILGVYIQSKIRRAQMKALALGAQCLEAATSLLQKLLVDLLQPHCQTEKSHQIQVGVELYTAWASKDVKSNYPRRTMRPSESQL